MPIVTNQTGITIPAGEFKARCLKLLDLVNQTHQTITITKRGRPVARLVALEEKKPMRTHGYLKGHVVSENDIVSPTGEIWSAENG